jgi:hypothetical protein
LGEQDRAAEHRAEDKERVHRASSVKEKQCSPHAYSLPARRDWRGAKFRSSSWPAGGGLSKKKMRRRNAATGDAGGLSTRASDIFQMPDKWCGADERKTPWKCFEIEKAVAVSNQRAEKADC